MTESSGPQFLRFLIPTVEVLKEFNEGAKPDVVVKKVTKRLNISDEEKNEKLKSGQYRVKNQIHWARNYLVEAGLLSKEKRGIWELTKKGYKSSLTEKEVKEIFKSAQAKHNKKNKETSVEKYNKQEALSDLFLGETKFDRIIKTLRRKKNIILQGPPGVGKTFIAKRIAYSLIELKKDLNIEMIQFHQSFTYEDFIQGFRPSGDGGFKLKNGIFYEFCKKAIQSNEPHIFIIDEINRGNLSKIFGELMLLIESDKRGQDYSIQLTYSESYEDKFFIPDNIYIIGTMNTADRSLSIVDYALRRRFAFIDLEPAFKTDKFKACLVNNGVAENFAKKVINRLNSINIQIESNPQLGRGYKIGHSYFSPIEKIESQEEWYKEIIETEIEPLISEYWFDEEEKSQEQIENLLSCL